MRDATAWALATLLGTAAGTIASTAFGWVEGVPWWTVPVAGALVGGACLGAIQGEVLRRVLPAVPRSRWTLATLAGALAGVLVVIGLSFLPSTPAGPFPTSGLVAGALLLGVAQWTVLHGRVPRAWTWIGWTVVGQTLGAVLGSLVFLPIALAAPETLSPPVGELLVGLVLGACSAVVLGLVTGHALVRLAAGTPPPRRADATSS